MNRALSILIVASLFFSGCIGSETGFEINGTEYKNPPDAPDFTLLNQDGRAVSLSDFDGKVVVVAFIYTSCPDVCLAISANLDYIYDNLGGYSDDVVILSITIDPARDTVSRFAEWTEHFGYEWDHLSSQHASTLVEVWDSWNIVVDNDHILASSPPEDAMNRFAVLHANNSSTIYDRVWDDLEQMSIGDFSDTAFNESGFELNSNDTYTLHHWDATSWSWVESPENHTAQTLSYETHLAWAADDSDLSALRAGIDCNGKGWVMGSGTGAHCMCDEGYERDSGNWLSCIMEDTGDSDNLSADSGNNDPHEDSLGEYGVGHSTVTFILDKQLRKRVAWTGIDWDVSLFLEDLQNLADE